jgi:oligoendopeptidase F
MKKVKTMAPSDQTSTQPADHKQDENLPRWDLSDFYDNYKDPAIEAEFNALESEAADFANRYQGQLAELSGDDLAKAIIELEEIDERATKIGSYAFLLHSTKLKDEEVGQFYQQTQERLTDIQRPLIFFTLELNKLSDDQVMAKLTSTELQKYAPYIEKIRLYRDHQLSDELEQFLNDKSVVGRSAWNRLFDEYIADLIFTVDGEEYNMSEVSNLLQSADRDLRRRAAHEIGDVLDENKKVLSLITNTLAKDKEIMDNWRGYDHPVAARNLSNQVDDDVVNALVTSVKDSYGDLTHRYYALKAEMMGLDKLAYWDRNAPLPEASEDYITWEMAEEMVKDAYQGFSADLAEIGKRFFRDKRIDVPPAKGKRQGAYSASTVPSVHPYIMLNYQGKPRDVMTLAHELGHGIHQVLAGQEQGHFMSSTPLTLAETASVFGEMLTFQKLLADTQDMDQRRHLLANKIEDNLNTVVRQIAFFDFEHRLHTTRRESGELTHDQISEIWMDVSRKSLGPAVELDEKYRSYWSYIPHFIHSPFYVYAYAFGNCLVNALYALYQESEDGFVEKYTDLLAAGGSKKHGELLAPFGLDASDPSFWDKGLSVVSDLIDQLEEIA